MKLRTIILSCLIIIITQANSQIRLPGYYSQKIDSSLYRNSWDAHWISVPHSASKDYAVCHFRKTFDLNEMPVQFNVHVSADNRYKLYINGNLVSLGPAGGDILNWNFETVDLAPYLTTGENVIAAIVWNFGEKRPMAQISYGKTELLVQGNTNAESIVNTDTSWKCMESRAYKPLDNAVFGYYVAGPGEEFVSENYPWKWLDTHFLDGTWLNAQQGFKGAMKGAVDYPGRLLVPSPLPQLSREKIRFASLRKVEGIVLPTSFPSKGAAFSVPPNTKVHMIIDQGNLMTGYPIFKYSKGAGAKIQIGFAESYYSDPHDGSKGNRHEIENKTFVGYRDMIVADDGRDRVYSPLWWRTWRYLDIVIETKDQTLFVDDMEAVFSAYPFQKTSGFESPANPILENILEVGWRTAQLCAHDTYMDCPYYEQLQYFGDTRIQAMITLYNTNDDIMVKNALEQGRRSLVADGITMSRYPTNTHQFIPSFSLFWIGMGYDFWWYRGNEEYMKTLLPAYRSVLSWFEQYLLETNSLDHIPFWFFGDWAHGFDRGVPPREKDGKSAFQDLLYLMTLKEACQMEEAFGDKMVAKHYREIIDRVTKNVKEVYWDSEKKMFADTYNHTSYSQHVNALAILTDIIAERDGADLMTRILEDKGITQTTIYFRYYLQRAMQKVGLGEKLLEQLDIWTDQIDLGLTTWAEEPEPSRSDCHAWGASPNIEFFRMVLGIDSDAPGFRKIYINPALGALKNVSGKIPHPKGEISVSYEIVNDKLTAKIAIPEDLTGIFVWKNRSYKLYGGTQTITTQ